MINNYQDCLKELNTLIQEKSDKKCIEKCKSLLDKANKYTTKLDAEVIPNIDGCATVAFGHKNSWIEIKSLVRGYDCRIEDGIGWDYMVIDDVQNISLKDVLRKLDRFVRALS